MLHGKSKNFHSTVQEYIKDIEFEYYVTNTREYGENSVRRGGWIFEDDPCTEFNPQYVHDTIVADLIIKNENRTWARYIPRIERAVDAVLSHSRKIDLEPDEWPVMIEIAQRVKDHLPNIQIVPDGKD